MRDNAAMQQEVDMKAREKELNYRPSTLEESMKRIRLFGKMTLLGRTMK